jgi:lycopene beta-cyclase
MTEPNYDMLIVGAGPAGLALTAALAEQASGLRVGLLSPTHPAPWPNTYGAWMDELEAVGLARCAERSWAQPTVELTGGRRQRLDRTYTLMDNESLRASLRDRCQKGDVTEIEGVAEAWERAAPGTLRVEGRGGDAWRANLVVDATGHRPTLLRSELGTAGFQRAWGIVAEVDGEPLPSDTAMTLMDYRDDYLNDEPDVQPTFLYGMHFGENRYFLEETSLVARPAMDFQTLERRLERRLEARGVTVETILERERVSFPMGQPLPDVDQSVVGFGAAAGMVHPATGYMVGRMIGHADRVAGAAARAIPSADTVEARASEVWRAVWPEPLRRTRHLLSFGLETLLELEGDALRDFFDAFFELDRADWSDYMSGESNPAATARIMTTVFRHASLGLRGDLLRRAASPEIGHLVRALIPNLR